MAIVTTSYRPKQAPRKKRKQPALTSRIVTPAPVKKRVGPVIRLSEQAGEPQPKRSAIVETRSPADPALDLTPEDVRRRGEAADELFREIVRRAAASEGD